MEEMAAGVGEGAVCVSGVSVTQEATVCLKGGCECPRMSRTGCKIHVCVLGSQEIQQRVILHRGRGGIALMAIRM